MILYLVTLAHGDTLIDALHDGGCPRMYYSREIAEKELPMLISRDKQGDYTVKPINVTEVLPWEK